MKDIALFWYRADLRLADNPGLTAAAQHASVLPVYIFDEDEGGDWAVGGASRWWLHQSISDLGERIASAGGKLILRHGKVAEVLPSLAQEIGASHVYCSQQYQPWADNTEQNVNQSLAKVGVKMKRFPGTLLYQPGSIVTGGGSLFKVFTPFWRACLRAEPPKRPLPQPELRWYAETEVPSDPLASWSLEPSNPNWAQGWDAVWSPGERGARAALDHFLEQRVLKYGSGRDRPGEQHTSRLSPHLKFGELSPRQVWHAAHIAQAAHGETGGNVDKFLSEIGWREFCNHLVALFPAMPDEAFNPKFADFPWAGEPQTLVAWQRGMTGYPFVDAGMRELWQTGFMHNRVRMVVASFLCKHLLHHWREGQHWFWDCLLDADLASNACSWQWVAGSGADASPYFRIFNPVAQGEKFDKCGQYTRRWVPEIAALPDKYLHKPWEAPDKLLQTTGIRLGESYPCPIVDHKAAREAALAAYGRIRESQAS